MFNPVIIVAIIVQALIAQGSRIAGAVVGYLITTGILVWGLSVYADGSQIALFSIPLSEPVFIVACMVWYGFDTKEFVDARNSLGQEDAQQLQHPHSEESRTDIES